MHIMLVDQKCNFKFILIAFSSTSIKENNNSIESPLDWSMQIQHIEEPSYGGSSHYVLAPTIIIKKTPCHVMLLATKNS